MAAARRSVLSLTGWTSKFVHALRLQMTGGRKICWTLSRSHSTPPFSRSLLLGGGRWYSSEAGDLLSCVEKDIALEQEVAEDLPEVAGFATTLSGCLATLHRTQGGERMLVELDANHAVELMPEELHEEEPFFAPAFTMTITNPHGSRLQLECSFNECGEYVGQGKEWDNFNVNSLSVVPPDCSTPEAVYSVSADNMSDELYNSLLSYLEARGIGHTFSRDIYQFYKVHEHKCYLEYGLKAFRKYLQNA